MYDQNLFGLRFLPKLEKKRKMNSNDVVDLSIKFISNRLFQILLTSIIQTPVNLLSNIHNNINIL